MVGRILKRVREAVESGEPRRLWLAHEAAVSAHEKHSSLIGIADWFRRRGEPGDVDAAEWCERLATAEWQRALAGITGPGTKERNCGYYQRVHRAGF